MALKLSKLALIFRTLKLSNLLTAPIFPWLAPIPVLLAYHVLITPMSLPQTLIALPLTPITKDSNYVTKKDIEQGTRFGILESDLYYLQFYI